MCNERQSTIQEEKDFGLCEVCMKFIDRDISSLEQQWNIPQQQQPMNMPQQQQSLLNIPQQQQRMTMPQQQPNTRNVCTSRGTIIKCV